MDYINGLPTELLVRIFACYIDLVGHEKFLKNIPLVCKRWNDIHRNPSLWSDLQSYEWKPFVMNMLGEKGMLSSTQSLLLEAYDEREVLKVFPYCRNLKKLMFSGCTLTKDSMKHLAEQCSNIEKLIFICCEGHPEDILYRFLAVRGQNLKRLGLVHCHSANFVKAVAKYCPSIEQVEFHEFSSHIAATQFIRFPIDKLVIGCPQLRHICLSGYNLTFSELRYHKFENVASFGAFKTDFRGMDLYSVLEDSKDLERLALFRCGNLTLRNIPKIPSDKMKIFILEGRNQAKDCPTHVLVEVAAKWRRTLTLLCLSGLKRDLTEVLKAYMYENPDPKLEQLDFMHSKVEIQVLKSLMRASKNLKYVRVQGLISFRGRRDIEDFCEAVE